MSSRETVRAFRDSGAFEPPRQPSPAWLGTAAFGLAAVALAALAFFGVQTLLPRPSVSPLTTTVDASFSDVQATLRPATGAPAVKTMPLTPRQAGLSTAESKTCSKRANDARDNAVTADMRSRSNELVLSYVRRLAGSAGYVQCLATTRPPRLCEASQQEGFLFFARAAASDYDGALKVSQFSDAEIRQLQAHNPVMGRQSLQAIRADFAKMLAAEQQQVKSIQRSVFGLTAAGIIPVDALTAHLGFDSFDNTWRALAASAPSAPSVCGA